MKTILKRALCGITAFVVAAGAMSYFPADTFPGIARGVTAYAENETNETWRITITADNLADISGDGSEGSPYEITTAEELLAVMEARRTIYAILNDDIVINKDLLKRIDKESGEPSDTSDSIVCWPPIPDGWCINLDGKNHTISGLYINESGKAGLYASLGVGSFKNLTITDSFVKGGDNVGVLIGDSSYSTDSLSADNVKIENTIVRGNNCVGGLFGSLETTTDKTKYARYVVYPSKTGYHNHGSADQIDCDDCRGVAWDPYYYVPKNYADTSQYEITNYHELLGLAKLVNEKNETITASLMNDIVFNENLLDASGNVQVADPIKWTPIGNVQVANPIKWTPIGTERFYFNGIFNGNGHTISGLYVDGGDYAGLFGKAQGAPRIKGVGIVDSYFKGAKYVGGIAGAYIDVNGIEFDCMAGCFTYNVKLEGTESTTKIGQFIGDISGKGNAKLNSNYCLAEKEEPLPGINCSTMTAEDFESGKVAYLMNKYFTDKGNGDVWGQVVANNENVPVDLFPTAYKIIDNGGSNKVINCAGQYHNHLGSATCPICQTVNPQEPAKDNGVYQIGTPSELLWLADRVNGGSGNQDAVLTNDIDMTGVKWTPIGTKDKAFEWGEFDGQGHFITNLTVNDSSLEYAGLFGYVTDHATIKNLGVFGEFSGGKYVGGIAGYSENSEITNCFFIGTVSGTNTNGIANGDTIENCYFQSDSTDINARTEKQFKSGEVAELLNMLPNGGTQEVWGQTIGADAYPCALTSDNKVIRDYTNLGWHNHTNGTTEDTCPNCVKTPKQENGVYQISTIQELYWFSAYVNNTDSSIKAELANNITVNEDISAQKRIIWTPIGTETKPFTGTFDGKGHIISGLVKENSTEPVGLFGVIGSGAEVSNVGVVNCIFSSTADAGGIAGINEGTITDSYIYNISPGNGAPIAASGTGKTDNCFVLNTTNDPAEIAYKLNRSSQTWGCKIGDDKLPTAINEENRVYFGKTYHNHDKNTLYCNDCCDFILTKPTEESGWYLISEPGNLAWFARLINGGIDAEDHTNAKAKLTEDLDFSAYTGYNWTPIGTEDNPFSGIFDGNSHTISGLKSSGADHAGLFGYADGASISKLIVNGCDFSGNKSAAAMCGSVGTNGVTFNFCGSYDNTLAETSTAGFAGISAGKVTLDRCYTADRDKFSDGNNRVSVSYAISGNAADDAMTEAQFKSGELTYALNNGLDKAVWFQTINTQAYPQFSGDTVYKTSPCVSYTNDSAKTNKPHVIGDDDKCKVCGERGIPKKNSNGQYELSSKLHMLWFAKNFSSGEDSAVLMDNIDMKDAEWTPIGTADKPFSGNFDGNGHTISGLNYSGEYAGLFGYMNNGTISNIKLADSSFANGTASGGICAVNNGGTIENCAVDNVAVSGGTAGGICGQNSGTITDCFFSGNVSSDGKSGGICGSNSGTIKSTVSLYAGAAVGENAKGDIEYCFYNSDIAGRQKFGSGLETTGLTDPSILKKLGNSWSKAANTTTVLFYPELTVFKTDKYSVRVKYRLTLENTDKAPAYKDTLHFVFDVQSAPENSKKWNSIVANLAYNDVRQQDFELSLDGVKLEIDAAPVVGNRLNLMLDGGKIGVLYMDKTLKVRIEITYPLNAGKHTISVKYVGSGFDYLAGESAECAFTISKAIITDPEASVEYGKALKDAELTEGWEWTNSSAVPNSKSRKFKAVMTVDDENYDLSGIKGLNGNKLTREVEVSFKKAVPAVTVTTDPFSALPGTKITVSVSAVNPNNAKFSDVPAAELFYTVGGTGTAITGGSFVIPDGLEEETVITVTAKTEENEFYKAGNGSAEVIVSAHKWSREWKTDKDGHWRECTDCGIAGEKSAHVSGGAATETTAEKCTVCGYVITPALKVVEAPIITPDGGSFTGSQTVTIICATDGAAIHYTTDGTEPTASSTKYSGGFTITATTTIKAVAFVGEAKSSVTSAAFTRKAQSGGSGGSVRPTRPDTEPRPSIDGKSMSWAEISVELAKRQDGSTVKIMLNGAYEVPADVIRVIAGKKLHIEFVADSLKSWLTDGAKISAVTAADLSAIPGSADRSALRGISGADLRVSGTKIPADLKLSFRKEFAGQFANVYKPANGKLVFHGCAKLGADGAAIIPGADSEDEYVVMVCEFSDMPGDINNDGVLNALDASAVLKCVVGISQGANPLMGDFNKDGTVNAIDASDILKWIIRS
ncbi:the GLUG motif [Eubacterium sp. CAG:115]|nr:the GLUG motif [Eubacterium sp. CAG:115]